MVSAGPSGALRPKTARLVVMVFDDSGSMPCCFSPPGYLTISHRKQEANRSSCQRSACGGMAS